MQKFIRIVLWICLAPLTSILVAEEKQDIAVAEEKQDIALLQEKLEKNIPMIGIESISLSSMPGLYEIISSGQVYYVSEDARFLISGKLFSIEEGIKDLTAESLKQIEIQKAPLRSASINKVNQSDMIVFKAEEEKHRVTVFTDVDCSYCRQLHKQMDNYHKEGITVQYMGFPRAGIGSSSHKKLQTVWCAEDPLEAMNKAKIDRTFGNDICDDPLSKHVELVREFGLTGTPAIILKSGRLIPGYLNATDLLAIIEEDEAANTGTSATAK